MGSVVQVHGGSEFRGAQVERVVHRWREWQGSRCGCCRLPGAICAGAWWQQSCRKREVRTRISISPPNLGGREVGLWCTGGIIQIWWQSNFDAQASAAILGHPCHS